MPTRSERIAKAASFPVGHPARKAILRDLTDEDLEVREQEVLALATAAARQLRGPWKGVDQEEMGRVHHLININGGVGIYFDPVVLAKDAATLTKFFVQRGFSVVKPARIRGSHNGMNLQMMVEPPRRR